MRRPAGKGNRWEDHYTRQARKERYPARSVYKLRELQQRFNLVRRGDAVFDLGCAPGSWMMQAAELTGPTGRVIGIDLTPVTAALPPQAEARVQDVYALVENPVACFGRSFDVVLSDMAPSTTGSRGVDAARSLALCEAALAIALRVLRPGGNFVCKIFQGEDFKAFTEAVKAGFTDFKIFKPQSCRKASKEIYLIGKGRNQEESHVRAQ